MALDLRLVLRHHPPAMNFPTAAQLSDYPGLVPWLVEGTWREDFERKTLILGPGTDGISMGWMPTASY